MDVLLKQEFALNPRLTLELKKENRQKSIEDLLVGILRQESMTTRQLVDCLMSEPYREANITAQEIWLALLRLQEKKILKLDGFKRTFVGSLDIEPLLRIFL